MGYFNSRDSSTQSQQNISTSSTGEIGVNIGVVNFVILLFAVVGGTSSKNLRIAVLICIMLAILGIIFGVKGLLEKPKSELSWGAIASGVFMFILVFLVGAFILSWSGG